MLWIASLALSCMADKDRVVSDVKSQFAGQRWRVVCTESPSTLDREEIRTLRIFKNGQRLLTRSGIYLYDAVFIRWPYSGRLLAVAEHSSAGHGMQTWLYHADGKGVTDLKLKIDHEANGPVFRDLDRDGRPELVFDNNDWYEFYGDTPTRLRAYKFDGKRLRLWRDFPNRNHERLPFKLPYF